MAVASELDLAPTSQPNARQKPQLMQALRPGRGSDRIAIGAGNGCHPSFRAARSKITPEDFTGRGGIGYGFERGGSKGLAPARPETPISHSTFFLYKQKTAYVMGQSAKVVPEMGPILLRSMKSIS